MARGFCGGDLLDRLAAFGGGDDDGLADAAVDQDGGVELGGDIGLFLDQDAGDLGAAGAGLVGDEEVIGEAAVFLEGVLEALGEADAAAPGTDDGAFDVGGVGFEALVHLGGTSGGGDDAALAAATGVDLGLDDDLAAEFADDAARVADGGGAAAGGDGYAVGAQDCFGLVLVDIHGRRPSIACRSERVCTSSSGIR